MQMWPPNAGLPFVSSRWYDSTTLGLYDPVINVTCDPAGGAQITGLTLVPFNQWANGPRSFTSMAIDVDNVGASPNILMGIYANTNGQPTRLLPAAPQVTVAGTGALVSAFPTKITLDPGMYWLAFFMDGALNIGGWEGDSSAGPSEGFATIGNPTPDASGNTLKQFGWEITGLAFGLPQNLFPTPGGATQNDGYKMPRVCLLVE